MLYLGKAVEYHQRTLPFQIPRHRRYRVFGRYYHQHMHMIRHPVFFYAFYPFVSTTLTYHFLYILTVLPINSFSPMLQRENDWALHSHVVCARFCSFAIKNTFSIVSWGLNNSVLSKRCFLCIIFVVHRLSRRFTASVAIALNSLKALMKKRPCKSKGAFPVFYPCWDSDGSIYVVSRSSKAVNSGRYASSTVPVGPLRCLPMMISALPVRT